ncbi:hypothetical protein CEQ90_04760 [Lewinellaceae bacterium SD302]|nr:hypothetical protein CEQ90_04760 [Lewinellaceae bacterium SD302]
MQKQFNQLYGLLAILIISGVVACGTPGAVTSSEASDSQDNSTSTSTSTATSSANENLSPCPKFDDSPNSDRLSDDYVIYRQMMKTKDYAEAFPRWKNVYENAPAADGKRNTVYLDGVTLYQDLATRFPDRANGIGDTIQLLYAQARECYPDDGFTAAMQGFDGYYKYPENTTHREVFDLFRESIDKDGDELEYFIINPMSSLLVEMHDTGYIDDTEARALTTILLKRLETGLAECQGSGCDPWQAIEAYAPARLEYFETVRDFYDCQHYVDKYMPEFRDNPTDCDVIRTTGTLLRWGNCGTDSPEYQEVQAAFDASCKVVYEPGPARQGYTCLENNDYGCAIEKFTEAANGAEDAEKKGKYFLTVAKIYYSHLKNFSQARAFARKAANARSSWGEPYLLIGRLYASSGPLCGPGRGFDSQVVVWPAIDMWNRAKSVDPSAAAEANKFIGRYAQYMPSKEDVFQRGLKEGDTFRVGCWINESTRIRTP